MSSRPSSVQERSLFSASRAPASDWVRSVRVATFQISSCGMVSRVAIARRSLCGDQASVPIVRGVLRIAVVSPVAVLSNSRRAGAGRV